MISSDLLVECTQGFVPGWTKNALIKMSPDLANYLIKNEDKIVSEHKLYTPEGNIYWLLDGDKLTKIIQTFFDDNESI